MMVKFPALTTMLLSVGIGVLISGCSSTDLSEFQTLVIHQTTSVDSRPAHRYGIPFRSGQVIVSAADTPVSFMITLMASEYAAFGHAGVVMVEDGDVYVYDAFAYLGLRFWDPPTKRLRGSIRRIKLSAFLNRVAAARVYQHDSLNLDAIAAYARGAHDRKVPFDGLFDSRASDALYCSEFVAMALQAGGYQAVQVVARTLNSSMNNAMAWLAVTAPEFILTPGLLQQATPIATLSRRYSSAELDALIAYQAELHRRFTTEQALGNVLIWTSTGPRFRPHLDDLRAEILRGADLADDPRRWAADKVRQRLRSPVHEASGPELASNADVE